jgi:hypothetical protein
LNNGRRTEVLRRYYGGTTEVSAGGSGLRRYAVWAGTRALVTLGTSVEPSMRRQVRMKMTVPTGGTPYRALEFHVVSGTRLPRCWFPHPQSGGCGDHRLTGASDASRIKCRHVERSRTLPPIVPALPWRTSVGSCTYIVSREHTRKAEPSQSFSLRKASRTTPQLVLSPLRLSAVK